MNKMENNNGRGIFYGVIGVATLIVAIIGATFAYFSASVRSQNNAITAGASVITLGITENVTGTLLQSDMIPVEANGETTNTAYGAENAQADAAVFPNFPSAGTEDTNPKQDGVQARAACKDLYGNNICSIYTFTIENTATAAQQIYGYLTVELNEFSSLKYAVFKGTAENVGAAADKWKVLGNNPTADANGNYSVANGGLVHRIDDVPTEVTTDANATAEAIPGMTVTLQPEEEVTYTVLVWIEETGGDQTATDSKKEDNSARTFAGGILVNTSGGGNGVTGTLRLSA